MARPSKLHQHKSGQWTATINGRQLYFGKDERQAQAKFYRAMARALEVNPTDRPGITEPLVWLYDRINKYANSKLAKSKSKPTAMSWLELRRNDEHESKWNR